MDTKQKLPKPWPPATHTAGSLTYLSVGLLVALKELVVVLLVGPGGEEESEGGADGSHDGEDARVIHTQSLCVGVYWWLMSR